MKTPKEYHRLTSFEREEISRGLAQGESMATIGGCLGRETSTISREVAGNRLNSGYRAFSADNRAIERASWRRRGKNRLAREDDLRTYVHEKLKKRWSPRQIVKRMEEEYRFDMAMRVSHETIYRYIYVDGERIVENYVDQSFTPGTQIPKDPKTGQHRRNGRQNSRHAVH